MYVSVVGVGMVVLTSPLAVINALGFKRKVLTQDNRCSPCFSDDIAGDNASMRSQYAHHQRASSRDLIRARPAGFIGDGPTAV